VNARWTLYGPGVSNGWADIDWDAPRPEYRDITRSHKQVTYERVPVEHPDVTVVLDELGRTHVNGGALLGGFRVVDGDTVISWFASRNRFDEYDFSQHFLGSRAVREAFPQLRVPEPLVRDLGFKESWTGSLTLDGEVAATLVHGGAYERFKGTPVEAKQLGAAFVEALVGERHHDFKVYASHQPRAPWFCDIAWDATWALIDQRAAVIYLLCVTDTD
jgi:hypothetical protein